MPINWISNGDNGELFKKFFKTAVEGGWKLLLNHVCNTQLGNRQRGNGLGNIHGARYGVVVPVNSISQVQTGSGPSCPKASHKIRNVTPTQQAVEIAHSEEKREEEEASHSSSLTTKRPCKSKKTHSTKKYRADKTPYKLLEKSTKNSKRQS